MENVLEEENKILVFGRFCICRFNFECDAFYIIICNKYVALSNLSMYYTWENIKSRQVYFEYILNKIKNSENPPRLEITEIILVHCKIFNNIFNKFLSKRFKSLVYVRLFQTNHLVNLVNLLDILPPKLHF